MMESLNSAIVRIFATDGAIVGTGFLISERHLLTCAHVVAEALGYEADRPEAPASPITLDFPLVALGEKREARVVGWNSLPLRQTPIGTDDVAVLELTSAPPASVKVVPLREPKAVSKQNCRVFGFSVKHDRGVWLPGILRGPIAGGWIQLDGTADGAYFVEEGFSGAPVWDDEQQAIVGMVAPVEERRPVKGSSEHRLAFMIPIPLLAQAWPALADGLADGLAYGSKETPLGDRDPYVGLRTFQEEDAELFCGRDKLIERLQQKVENASFLAVLGPSGSGKSSVVLAGLLPALKRGDEPDRDKWRYLTIKPGTRPLDTLAAALTTLLGGDLGRALTLRQSFIENSRALLMTAEMLFSGKVSGRLVLIVDQFEELWTLVPHEQEARQRFISEQQQPFIRQLLTAVTAPSTPVLVILTMRADFLHRAAENRELARQIERHNVIVSPMQPDELRQAIINPASYGGGHFEPGLVDELISQTIGQPGGMPLLEYTLLELWKAKRPDAKGTPTMTWDAFHQLGGVEGALAKRADAILANRYTKEQQNQLRDLLLRLVQPGEGATDTRRRILLDDLVPAGSDRESVRLLLKPLVDERLLTTSRDLAKDAETLELSHEALIRAWPTFAQWIEKAREDLPLQLQLEKAAKESSRAGMPVGR